MKAALLLLALVGGSVLTAHASSRRLQQANAPASGSTVFDVAEANGLTSLVDAAQLDSLDSSLDNATLGYTIFAPTNDAFENFLSASGFTDLQDFLENSYGSLDPTLQYHFLTTPYTEDQLLTAGTVTTNFDDQTLTISEDGTITAFNSTATIVTPNVPAGASIIHVIDTVLVPDFAEAGVGVAPSAV